MKLFYYVHTGHRVGLDRFRRAVTILRGLGEVDITLLTSDFRSATMAQGYGVKRAIGIDVVQNIPQIAQRGDKIIFDSPEVSPALLEEMTHFFSTFIRFDDCIDIQKLPNEYVISPYYEGERVYRGVVIDPKYFKSLKKNGERLFFFGDDDYEEVIVKHLEIFQGHGLSVLLGVYWFLDYETKVGVVFENQYASEYYDDVIQKSDVLVTASPQAVLEHLASGGRPIFLQRLDRSEDYLPLLEGFGIPIVKGYDSAYLRGVLDKIDTINLAPVSNNTHKLIEFIKSTLDL